MPTCCHLATQTRLPWQRPLTEVHQILSRRIFLIGGVYATIHVAIRPPAVERKGRQEKKRK